MKTPKFTKFLPVALALTLATTGCSFAASEYAEGDNKNTSEPVAFELTLDEFFDVEQHATNTKSEVKYDEDYEGITLLSPLTGTFEVVSNIQKKNVYLYGTCNAGGEKAAIYANEAGEYRLIFTNQGGTEGSVAADANAVKNLRDKTNQKEDNANAIAFALAVSAEAANGSADGEVANTFADGKNILFEAPNGKTTITFNVSGTAQDNSFSTHDTFGKYMATLYVSGNPQTIE